MMTLTENQMALLVGYYVVEYDPKEIIPMILEADIVEDHRSIILTWDNGASDVFRKIRVYYDDMDNRYYDVLKIDDFGDSDDEDDEE